MKIDTLVLATHNKGKVKEFEEMLKGLVGTLKCAGDFGLPEPEETGATFAENALLKAKAAAAATGLPCLADDSGMCVDALDGAPGIYSARWAGPDKDFKAAMLRVNEEIGAIDGTQTARFVAVLALALPDGSGETFEGTIEGTLVWPPRGDKGFGYDPMFVPQGGDRTFGEMDVGEKHAISHRAKAVAKLKDHLNR